MVGINHDDIHGRTPKLTGKSAFIDRSCRNRNRRILQQTAIANMIFYYKAAACRKPLKPKIDEWIVRTDGNMHDAENQNRYEGR